jgi:hypothetical protein
MSRRTLASREHELEALYRLDAVRTVTEALLAGHWALDPEVLAELGNLLAAAEAWSRRAA